MLPDYRRVCALAACTTLLACSADRDSAMIVGELASDRIELTAELSEPIVEILVAEGEAVAANQVLIRQDTTRASARVAEAEAMLAMAQAWLDELVRGPRSEQIAAARASLAGAEDELRFRQADFGRIERLHAQELAAAGTLDQARADLDAAEADLAVRKAQLEELLNGTTVEELAQAEAAVRLAAARLAQSRVDLDRLDIRAPIDGLIDSRLFELGERPASGQVLLVLLPGEQAYARIYVPEEQRVNVRPGVAARIFVDGRSAPVSGRISWVASEAAFTPYYALTEKDRRRLSYLAKVAITEKIERLPDGVPVEVELLIGTQE